MVGHKAAVHSSLWTGKGSKARTSGTNCVEPVQGIFYEESLANHNHSPNKQRERYRERERETERQTYTYTTQKQNCLRQGRSVQLSWPRRVANHWFTRPGIWEHFAGFIWKTAKHGVHKIFSRGPQKLPNTLFFGIGPHPVSFDGRVLRRKRKRRMLPV